MEKALKNLELKLPKTSLGGWNYGNEIPAWRRYFEVIQSMPGASRKFDAIANERDVEQLNDTLTEIENRFRQAGTEGIIAIWNSNDELTPHEVETAVYRLKLHSNHSQKSSFVLLRRDPCEKFSCFELRNRLAPYQEQWMSELKQVTPDDILGRISDESRFRGRG